jgi:very-short-patch-repair endonuclease
VDVPLADLFLHAAAQLIPTPEGHAHARSATEAFLYRRLQTLSLTRGRFKLNVRLPIQFDDRGEMEIDLLDADARLAVELDGPQHLADPEAYRRDRRKDILLQENGYIVLRFLTDDVSKRLSDVLDTLTRILVSRTTSQ